MAERTAAPTQPSRTSDQKLNELLDRRREARARLEYLRAQIGPAKRDAEAAAWAVQGYKNRLQAAPQLAEVR